MTFETYEESRLWPHCAESAFIDGALNIII